MRIVLLSSTLLTLVPLWGHGATPQGYCDPNIPGRFSNRYTTNNDNTVTDRVTGLTWQRCPLGDGMIASSKECGNALRFTWKEAMNWKDQPGLRKDAQQIAATEKLAKDGWRPPNIKELFSLAELHCRDYKIDISAFPMNEFVFWSNTPDIVQNGLVSTDKKLLPVTGGPVDGRPAYDYKPSTIAESVVVVQENLEFYHQAYYMDFTQVKFQRARIVETSNDIYRYAVILVCEKNGACNQNRPGGGSL